MSACPTCGSPQTHFGSIYYWCPTCGTAQERWFDGEKVRDESPSVPRIAAVLRDAAEAEESIEIDPMEHGHWGAVVGESDCICDTPIAALAGCWREPEKQV